MDLARKKKSKSKPKDKYKEVEAEAEAARIRELEKVLEEERKSSSPGPAGSSRSSPALVNSERKTAADKRFEEVQKKRVRHFEGLTVDFLSLGHRCCSLLRK